MKPSTAARRSSLLLTTACLGLALAALVVPRPASAAVFSNPTPIVIPSAGSSSAYPGTIQVSGLTGQTTDVNVTLHGFGHELPRDAGVMLVPPSGTAIPLMYEAGGSSPVTGLTLVFDDSAPSQIAMGPTLTGGAYKPTANVPGFEFPAPGPGFDYCNPGPAGFTPFCTLASAFNGADPNGTWSLFVRDFVGPSKDGQIAGGWSLDISVPPPASTTSPSTSAPPTDTKAPDTKLTKKPAKKGTARKVKFAFSSTEAGSSFQCKLDKGKFKACTSPFDKTVSPGAHSFQVRAIDIAGNVDASPAKYDFRVKKISSS